MLRIDCGLPEDLNKTSCEIILMTIVGVCELDDWSRVCLVSPVFVIIIVTHSFDSSVQMLACTVTTLIMVSPLIVSVFVLPASPLAL